MNLDPIATALQTAGLGTVGKTIFRRHMPAQVAKGLLVTAQTPVAIDPYVRKMFSGSFQVIARSSTYDESRDLANSVIDAMEGYGQVIGGMKFRHILARHTPLLFPKSDSDLVEASVNFDFVYTT